jgi:hypothetical protein
MEPLWSPAGATSRNRSQMLRPGKRRKQAKTVADGCHRLPATFHGKQGVCRGLPPVARGPLPAEEGVDSFAWRCYFLLLQSGHGHWSQPQPVHACMPCGSRLDFTRFEINPGACRVTVGSLKERCNEQGKRGIWSLQVEKFVLGRTGSENRYRFGSARDDRAPIRSPCVPC